MDKRSVTHGKQIQDTGSVGGEQGRRAVCVLTWHGWSWGGCVLTWHGWKWGGLCADVAWIELCGLVLTGHGWSWCALCTDLAWMHVR